MAEWIPFSSVFTGTPTPTDPLISAWTGVGNDGTSWAVTPVAAYADQLDASTQVRIGVDFWDGANEIGLIFGSESVEYLNIWGDYGGNPRTITGLAPPWSSFTLLTTFPATVPTNGLLELDVHLFLEPAEEAETCCVLYKTTGYTETVETFDLPKSTGGSYSTSATQQQQPKTPTYSNLSGGMWGSPVRPGQPGVKRQGSPKVPTPGGGTSGGGDNDSSNTNTRNNLTYVPSTGEDGSQGGTLFETDGSGNPTRQVGEHIPQSL